MRLEEIEEILKEKQSPHRFRHTTGVQYTSVCLAMRYGESIERAAYAGLLHDCAKHMNNEKLLAKAKKFQLPVTEIEERNPFLLHGEVGSYLAEHKYGVTDPEILSAIWYHTTGKPDMTLLEKIVFVADYIEPGRDKAPNLTELRQLAFTDLDEAVRAILKQTLDYLDSCGGEIDPATEKTYNYYINH